MQILSYANETKIHTTVGRGARAGHIALGMETTIYVTISIIQYTDPGDPVRGIDMDEIKSAYNAEKKIYYDHHTV
eukprot:15342755-Ditylum_brightwellii.AAC.1